MIGKQSNSKIANNAVILTINQLSSYLYWIRVLMVKMSKQEKISVYFLPTNFKTGVSIMGTTVSTTNLTQAILTIIPAEILIFWLLPSISTVFNFTFNIKVSISIPIDLILGYLCIVGINERPLFSYVSAWINFNKTKVHAFYNPRIKNEARPVYIDSDDSNMLPRDKLRKVYEKFKTKYDEKQHENAEKQQTLLMEDRNTVYFADDVGIVDKPVEYMTPKEYKTYKKKIHKMQKKKEKEEMRYIQSRKKQMQKLRKEGVSYEQIIPISFQEEKEERKD